MATTRTIAGTSNAKSPSRARRAASMAYATEETGSAITAKANAKSSAVRERRPLPSPPPGDVPLGIFTGTSGSMTALSSCRPDFPAHLRMPPARS
ncbi:hypothetical protein AHiyo1_15450 [Arthrobacter sp. Hiyo1]|nr:hypothetical protein AHiyo1_15450 [Arthrobacter sp. Hiyo1]